MHCMSNFMSAKVLTNTDLKLFALTSCQTAGCTSDAETYCGTYTLII